MAERIRVLLLIPHLGGGGAEQVTALVAQGLSEEKYDVHLGLVTCSAIPAHLLGGVTIHSIGARRARFAALPLIRLVRRLRPQVLLSGMAHLNFLVLLLRPFFPRRTRVVVRQNTTVSSALAADRRPRFTRKLYRLLYRRSDRVICQSCAMAEDLAAELGIERQRIAVLANPLDFERIRAARDGPNLWRGPGPHLLAVGRLAPEKGFDLLVEAFAAIRVQFPAAELVIVGDGSERATLESLSRRLRVATAVRFTGQLDNPCRFYPGATLFVLSSRREGMPNALLEAAAGGLPLVALPASGGVVDFLAECAGAWVARSISGAALTEVLLEAMRVLAPAERFERQCLKCYVGAVGSYEEFLRATACLTD
jgi:glycosyltransferase involved in cell wall biosynthesis